MPTAEKIDLSALNAADIAAITASQIRPPVEKWNPLVVTESYMHIDAEGQWYHKGSPIKRPAMMQLFASILRREPDGRYALVTPYEKQFIEVDNVPFVIVDMRYDCLADGPQLSFQLNTGELLLADGSRPLRWEEDTGEDGRFYISVRPGLDAKMNRSTHFALIELLLEQEPSGKLQYADQCLYISAMADEASA